MKIPNLFHKRETRAVDLTDAIVTSILSTASGDVAEGLTAAKEIAAGWWQRAFSSAQITPAGVVADALEEHLGYIGRSLVEAGEAVFALDFDSGGLTLIPAHSVTVTGGPNPASWMYQLTLAGPSHTLTRRPLPANAVLHLFYVRGSRNPWRGISPIENSSTTRKLSDNLEHRLAQETGAATGKLIAVPNVQTTSQLQTDIRSMKGEITLVESTASAWGAGQTGAPPADFQTRRIGADPPASLPELRRDAERSVLAACGIPTDVLSGGDASGQREGYRRFLHGVIQPTADAVAAQVSRHFETEITFDFAKLFASDLSGRARAFGSMVKGGMDLAKAASLAGLMEAEE